MNPSLPLNAIAAPAVTELALRITAESGLYIRLSGEIECYLIGDCEEEAFWQAVSDDAQRRQVPLQTIARERGPGQFECRMEPAGPSEAAQAVESLKTIIEDVAARHAVTADFSALPDPQQPASALHWHLHMENANGQLVFLKRGAELSPPLAGALGGLLTTMPGLMPYFAPHEVSYARLRSGQDHVPTTVSWGGNNRSVALRLPESVVLTRRIEHRVCGADTDPWASVWAILIGVHYGLTQQLTPPGEQMYGNAGDAQYDLPKLPMSLDEALQASAAAEWLDRYIDG